MAGILGLSTPTALIVGGLIAAVVGYFLLQQARQRGLRNLLYAGGAIAAVIGIVMASGLSGPQPLAIAGGAAQASVSLQLSDADRLICSQDESRNLVVSFWDDEGPTAVRRNGTLLLVDQVTNTIRQNDITSTSGDTTLSDVISCGHPVCGYIQAHANSTNSLSEPFCLTAEQTVKEADVRSIRGVTQYSQPTMRLKDLDQAGDFVFDQGDSDANQFEIMGTGNSRANFTSTTNNATNKVVAADDDINYELQWQTQLTNTWMGKGALFALDTSADGQETDWDEDQFSLSSSDFVVVKVAGGGAAGGLLDAEDQQALIGSEIIWKLEPIDVGHSQKAGPVGDIDVAATLRGQTGEGVNADQDLVGRLVPIGDVRDDSDPNKVRRNVGFRNNGATRSPIAEFQTHQFAILID